MLDGLIHRQPLRSELLACDNHVDIVAAAQAVIGYREQCIGVRRQVDPDNIRLLVDHVIDEPRVLMAKAIVVLPPDVGTQEIVKRGDRSPPWNVVAHLQPFGVLVEHRVDDMDESFVAGKKPCRPVSR